MLDNLKLMLGIADTSQDKRLLWIISATTARLKMLLGDVDPPESMDYIIEEVSIARFNRIGSEGMSSQSVEGESINFNNNDFEAYMDEIQAFIDKQSVTEKKGGFRFL